MHAVRHRTRPVVVVLLIAIAASTLLNAASAFAHGFSSVVYIDMTSPEKGHVRTELQLEYDLLVVSAADAEHDDPLFRQGTPAFDAHDHAAEAKALDDHAKAVMAYIERHQRLTVKDGTACTPTQDGPARITQRDGTDYAIVDLDYRCPESGGAHELRSALFPNSEGYVRGTKTIVTYEELDLKSGTASLDARHPAFSTQQSLLTEYWEFFRLGANHLLTGIDHILFLLALIAGSRRLREIVLAASSFTIAHSVTFILAALGVVAVPSGLVEPTIALSIAIVAALHLRRIWELRGRAADVEEVGPGPLGLDAAGWTRLGVVFCFGLVHGLGFASALGIDQGASWSLLSSLVVFNLGIESVQLGLILLTFPVLTLLRRRAPLVNVGTTGTIAAGVCAMGLVWFFERAFLV
ncbi:MAG TPA: HupE/UreJ family protein [Baekduia sp.]|uniref:HupE/UreJ family protein n=1 Tax=Baekduia sp. TaxID=2600305 RepID=UPI002D78F8E8|nr:HupE/UreJ family protein [Baekduia sp.]HET6505588.1 HupE/UreJ family protein [Baekduia sp.]